MTISHYKEKRTLVGGDIERCAEISFKRYRKGISRRRKYTIRAKLSSEVTSATTNAIYRYRKPSSAIDVEGYAGENVDRHERGNFRRNLTSGDLLSWSKDPIKKPMIMTIDKSLKRDACELFKLVQKYMHDRKPKFGQSMEALALYITTKCWTNQELRDELYIQIIRQTTGNPRRDSVILGWELMAICLSLFPPSAKLQLYLKSYISHHMDTPERMMHTFASVCKKRLERMTQRTTSGGLQMPTLENIYQSRIQIFRPSMFGNTLEEIMAIQKYKYPDRRLPWIQTTLSEAVLRLNGAQTEGIFRVPADFNDVNTMKLYADQWQIVECADPHVPASLLKLWYRELYEPLIPNQFYNLCMEYYNDAEVAVQIVQKLPDINRLVLSYLIRFLQVFAAAENATVTKMNASNLAMVMAPNCLRCAVDDPLVLFENSKKEIIFMYHVILHLNTGYMEGMM